MPKKVTAPLSMNRNPFRSLGPARAAAPATVDDLLTISGSQGGFHKRSLLKKTLLPAKCGVLIFAKFTMRDHATCPSTFLAYLFLVPGSVSTVYFLTPPPSFFVQNRDFRYERQILRKGRFLLRATLARLSFGQSVRPAPDKSCGKFPPSLPPPLVSFVAFAKPFRHTTTAAEESTLWADYYRDSRLQ